MVGGQSCSECLETGVGDMGIGQCAMMSGMDELMFGTPRFYRNQSGNDTAEWPDGLKLVRLPDGRVKVGRQNSRIEGGKAAVTVQQFAGGSNPTAHVIVKFDALDGG